VASKTFGRLGCYIDRVGSSHLWLHCWSMVHFKGWKEGTTVLTPSCASALEFEYWCDELINEITKAKKYARRAYKKLKI